MAVYRHKRQRRKPMSEINVVPYIDVMLVLLIIFMITAPMLTQGVNVDLPTADSNAIDVPEDNSEPLVVSIDAEGKFYVTIGDKQDEPLEAQQLLVKVAAVLRRSPNTPVMVKGDSAVNYGQVVTVMTLLQKAGAPSVGLITKQTEIEPTP
ncbi:MAG: protein TolR [Gammaproteobacteria bacterium]|nr:protein TolR [Pseudomonadota bacterium]PCH62769.1 MAG: protein TolR [Gammaproteobacteria bacterium]